MSLLLLISVFCCGGLLTMSASLWLTLHRRPGRIPSTDTLQPFSSAFAIMANVPSPLFVHPRMDLASGLAPGNQDVDLERRRSRFQTSEAVEEWHSREEAPSFQPFIERRKSPRPCKRLDLVYARESMGDLSDPPVSSGRDRRRAGFAEALPAR